MDKARQLPAEKMTESMAEDGWQMTEEISMTED
jgi:hypothetical protein